MIRATARLVKNLLSNFEQKSSTLFFVKEFTSFGFELKFGFSENKDGLFVFTNYLKLGAFESENVTNLLFNVVRGS